MSTEEDGEPDLPLKQRFLKAVLFYGKVFCGFWVVAKKPRQSWIILRYSRITRNFVFALFVSELTGLLSALLLSVAFGFFGYDTRTTALAAIAVSHYVLDAPFDFWLWPRACKSSYPISRWKAMYAADMGYFYIAGKAVDWLSLSFKGFFAVVLLSHFAFSDIFAASLSHAIQIPLYMAIYTALCAPMLLARDEELTSLFEARRIKAKLFFFAADRFVALKSILARIFFWRRKALVIELCEWLRLFSIQTRAGPRIKIFATPRSCGAFFMV
jgi:hypothetical protein